MKINKKQAFTLVELIITFAILAILWTIALFSYYKYIWDSKKAANDIELVNIASVINKDLDLWWDLISPDEKENNTVNINWLEWEKWKLGNENLKKYKAIVQSTLSDNFKQKHIFFVSKDKKHYILELEDNNWDKQSVTNYRSQKDTLSIVTVKQCDILDSNNRKIWTWKQTLYDWINWSECKVISCELWYAINGNTCSESKDCEITDWNWNITWKWIQTLNNWEWSRCIFKKCNKWFDYDSKSNTCINQKSCDLTDWKWKKTWKWIQSFSNWKWSECTYQSCNNWYARDKNYCVQERECSANWWTGTQKYLSYWETTCHLTKCDDPRHIIENNVCKLDGEMVLEYSWISNWETITLPFKWEVNIKSIDWWDSWVNNCPTTANSSVSCLYKTWWNYTITVKWDTTWFWSIATAAWIDKLLRVSKWQWMNLQDLSYWFYWSKNLIYVPYNLDTSQVTTMEYMFAKAENFNWNIWSWDMTNVLSTWDMFAGAKKFNQNLSNWNTPNLMDMKGMFNWAISFNNWWYPFKINTSNVVFMSHVFVWATNFNQDISSWDVSSAKNMQWMFQWTNYFNRDISMWDVSNVEDMRDMFNYAVWFSGNLRKWNVFKIKSMPINFNLWWRIPYYNLPRWWTTWIK